MEEILDQSTFTSSHPPAAVTFSLIVRSGDVEMNPGPGRFPGVYVLGKLAKIK